LNKVYIPSRGPADWRALLAKPKRHWKTGFSARSLAHCWEEADGFPKSVRKALARSGIPLLRGAHLLLAIPEHQVPLPGGRACSQSDLFALASSNRELIAVVVEGKVAEPFDRPVRKWSLPKSRGKVERLDYLCGRLGVAQSAVADCGYQLLHRAASAVIEASRFGARNALMLVHSFSPSDAGWVDYKQFAALLGCHGAINTVEFARSLDGIDLYLGWVRGERRFLSS